jgi:hypothetical protein
VVEGEEGNHVCADNRLCPCKPAIEHEIPE